MPEGPQPPNWAHLTPEQQAAAWQQWQFQQQNLAMQRQLLAAQQRSARNSSTLVTVLVGIPLFIGFVALLIWIGLQLAG